MFRFLVTKVAWFNYASPPLDPILPFSLVRAHHPTDGPTKCVISRGMAVVPGCMVSWFLQNPGYIPVLGMNTLGDKVWHSSLEMPRAFLPGCPNLCLACWYPNLRLLLTHHLVFWLRSPPWFLLWRSPLSRVGIGSSSQFWCLCSLFFTITPESLRRAFPSTCLL